MLRLLTRAFFCLGLIIVFRWGFALAQPPVPFPGILQVEDACGPPRITPLRIIQRLLGEGVRISNLTLPSAINGGPALNTWCNNQGNNISLGMYRYTLPSNVPNTASQRDRPLPLDSGIIISSGFAKTAATPNTSEGTSTVTNFPGIAELGGNTFDGMFVEFDVIPLGTNLRFSYTLASEEYREYACTNFNDVFGFFITGPNPTNPSQPYNKRNIALIPGTSDPVEINTVHPTNPFVAGCVAQNEEYYKTNEAGSIFTYDGHTIDLKVNVEVVPCATYRLKLCVADRGDRIFDTSVFIEQLSSDLPKITTTFNSNRKEMLEGCTDLTVDLRRAIANRSQTFVIDAVGTATFPDDYDIFVNNVAITSLPFNLNFSLNEFQKSFRVKAKQDNLAEPVEHIRLFLKDCQGNVIDSVRVDGRTRVNIRDVDSLDIIPDIKGPPFQVFRCTPNQIIDVQAIPDADNYEWSSPPGPLNGEFTCLDPPKCSKVRIETIETESEYTLRASFGDCSGAGGIPKTFRVIPAILEIPKDTTICQGQSVQLNASGRSIYQWTPGTGLSCTDCPNPVANPNITTTYTLRATKGTCTTETQVKVTVEQSPPAQFANLANFYCLNSPSVTLAATPTGGAFRINGQPATVFNPATLGIGDHFVEYQLGFGRRCFEYVSKTVQVRNLPEISFPTLNDEYCANDAKFNLAALPTGGSFTINGGAATEFNPAALGAGLHTISYRYTSPGSNCENTASKQVRVLPVPQISFTNLANSYCVVQTIPVIPQVAIVDTDGSTSTGILPAFTPSALGVSMQTISFTFSGKNGCAVTITKNVQIAPEPVLAFTGLKDEYCVGGLPVMLAGRATPAGGTYRVNGVPADALRPGDFAVGAVVTIAYTYKDPNSCEKTISRTVRIVPDNMLPPTTSQAKACPDPQQPYLLEAISQAQFVPGMTFLWNNGASSRTLTLREPSQSGAYTVLVRDAEGCPLINRTFNIEIKCEPEFFIPTAFTPNGDGNNDILEIIGQDFGKLNFMVFNRWGEIVFRTNDRRIQWDGTRNGLPVPAGVYVWKATYENILNSEFKFEKMGRVTLIR